MPIDKFGRSSEIHHHQDLYDIYNIDKDIYVDFKNKSLTGVNTPKTRLDVVNKEYLEKYVSETLGKEDFITKTYLNQFIKEYDNKRVANVKKLLHEIFTTFRNRISVWPEHMNVSIKILKDLFQS